MATGFVVRLAAEKGQPVEHPHWIYSVQSPTARPYRPYRTWMVTPEPAQAKVWKTREAAERNAAEFSGDGTTYQFEVEEAPQ